MTVDRETKHVGHNVCCVHLLICKTLFQLVENAIRKPYLGWTSGTVTVTKF